MVSIAHALKLSIAELGSRWTPYSRASGSEVAAIKAAREALKTHDAILSAARLAVCALATRDEFQAEYDALDQAIRVATQAKEQ